MSESNLVKCARCDFEGDILSEMRVMGGATLGPQVDFGMAVKWYCDPCWQIVRHDPRERTRVDRFLDDAATWARASVGGISDEALSSMDSLPEGLRITPSDRDRWSRLRDKLNQIEELQDKEDLAILHRICRNLNKNPFVHMGKMKDYDTLRQDFDRLQKLSPKEREKLNG